MNPIAEYWYIKALSIDIRPAVEMGVRVSRSEANLNLGCPNGLGPYSHPTITAIRCCG